MEKKSANAALISEVLVGQIWHTKEIKRGREGQRRCRQREQDWDERSGKTKRGMIH